MADYKSMYYHLAGRMAATIDVLDTTTSVLQSTSAALQATSAALAALKDKLESAQQATEKMFIDTADDDDLDDDVTR